MKKSLALLTLALATSNAAHASFTWKEANQAIVNEHIQPRYQQLADAGHALDKDAKTFCTTPNEQTLAQLRQRYHQTMDGWAGVQHLRTGPAELFERYHRFQLWPDKHNTGNKQIAQLLDAEDKDALKVDRFRQGSVAVQGLSALERLLFGQNSDVAAFVANNTANYRCHLVEAISHNIADMSDGLVKEWRTQAPYEMLFISGGGMNYLLKEEKDISTREEITNVFFNNLYTQIQSIIDQKLLRPLGSDNKVKPRYLESWRSLRSMRNIELNLQALESMYNTGFAPLLLEHSNGKTVNEQIQQAFKSAIAATKTLDKPLYQSLKSERAKVDALIAEVRQLQSLITGPLPDTLGIEMGFNALDGD